MTKLFTLVVLLTLAMLPCARAQNDSGVLFHERFDNSKLTERGWWRLWLTGGRSPRPSISLEGAGCIRISLSSTGIATVPDSSSIFRHLFAPSDTVCVRFHIRLSANWGWSGKPYHPHLMHFMTTENDRYHGPSESHLTLYIEPQNGKLRLSAQDIENAAEPHGLTQGPLRGGFNGREYDSSETLFKDDKWHTVEAFFRLNTLDMKADRPNADGIVRGWFDGKLVIDKTDVVLRSTDFPNMRFNQYLLAPYFGDGLLPHEQTLWIDDLTVKTARQVETGSG